jgi:hypothetical protein
MQNFVLKRWNQGLPEGKNLPPMPEKRFMAKNVAQPLVGLA